MGSYDLDFIRYMKYMPDKYLETITQLQAKTAECEELQKKVEQQGRLIQQLFEKVNLLQTKMELNKSRSSDLTPATLPAARNSPLGGSAPQQLKAFGRRREDNVGGPGRTNMGRGNGVSSLSPAPEASAVALTSTREPRDRGRWVNLSTEPLLKLSPPPRGAESHWPSQRVMPKRRVLGYPTQTPFAEEVTVIPMDDDIIDYSRVKQEAFDEHTAFVTDAETDFQFGYDQLAAISSTQRPSKFPLHHPSDMVLAGNFGITTEFPQQHDPTGTLHPSATYFASNNHSIHRVVANFDPSAPSSLSSYLVIVINDNCRSGRVSFFLALKSLLESYGNHVEHLTYCSPIDTSPVIWYRQTRDILRMMPNLKTIQLTVLPSHDKKDWCAGRELMELTETCQCITTFPLFGQLVLMDFLNVPYPVIEAALSVNKTLEKLQVTRTIDMYNWSRIGGLTLPNLTDLSITCFGMDEVEQLRGVKWPLKKLAIGLDFLLTPSPSPRMSKTYVDSPDIVSIFEVFQTFGETLNSLRITFYEHPGWSTTLVLPKLQALEVFFSGGASLNFLVDLGALEELRVHLCSERKDNWNDKIKFNGCISCMRRSNIWQILKGLKRVEFTSHFDGVSKTYMDENPHLPTRPSQSR